MEVRRATRSDARVALAVALVVALRVVRRLCPPSGAYQPSDPAAGWNTAGGCWPTARPPGGSLVRWIGSATRSPWCFACTTRTHSRVTHCDAAFTTSVPLFDAALVAALVSIHDPTAVARRRQLHPAVDYDHAPGRQPVIAGHSRAGSRRAPAAARRAGGLSEQAGAVTLHSGASRTATACYPWRSSLRGHAARTDLGHAPKTQIPQRVAAASQASAAEAHSWGYSGSQSEPPLRAARAVVNGALTNSAVSRGTSRSAQ